MIEEYREMFDKYRRGLITYDEWCDYCISTLRDLMIQDILKKG